MSDTFPATLEVLFDIPASFDDEALKPAITQLAETLKSDLVSVGAPVEVVMEASTCLNQFAKHMQASRKRYGYPEEGGYSDPGSERAALSSLHGGLTALREAMSRLRVTRVNPEALKQAIDERDQKFVAAAQKFLKACKDQEEALGGEDLMFFVQKTLFAYLQEGGLVE